MDSLNQSNPLLGRMRSAVTDACQKACLWILIGAYNMAGQQGHDQVTDERVAK